VTLVDQDGRGNDAALSFTGNNNGVGDFEGVLTGLAGVGQGTVTQALGANTLSYHVEGNRNRRNRFGFAQIGGGNGMDGGTTGDRNEIAGIQQGDGNSFDFSQQGDRNETALGQIGNDNEAVIDIVGSRNIAGVAQLGNRNQAGIDITGDGNVIAIGQAQNRNHADVTIDGSRNFAVIAQLHTPGAANRVTLNITGSDNNNPFMPHAGFNGAALTFAGALSPGAIVQAGSGNTITMNVGQTNPASNSNLFAFAQTGDSNQIRGSTNGSFNQAVIVQDGAGNLVNFVQIGNYNIIGVSQ
jgi:hypothetical protein